MMPKQREGLSMLIDTGKGPISQAADINEAVFDAMSR